MHIYWITKFIFDGFLCCILRLDKQHYDGRGLCLWSRLFLLVLFGSFF